MSKIYAFCGRKRSGKSVLSNIIKEKYDGVIVTIANYLKCICCDILECSIDELNSNKDNGMIFSLYPDERWIDIIHIKTNINKNLIQADISNIEFRNIRQMLQVIGTDCIRKHNPNWHVNCMKNDLKKYISEGKVIAVDDVRFPNEREAIEKLGGECYFIIRPMNIGISNHMSETSLLWNMFDSNHIIINEEDLETFKNNFIIHCDNNFEKDKIHSSFLAEKSHYTDMNILFGQVHNALVDEILSQNKEYEPFIKSGIIKFKPTSAQLHHEFISEIYNKNIKSDININTHYIVNNPIINENLKLYI